MPAHRAPRRIRAAFLSICLAIRFCLACCYSFLLIIAQLDLKSTSFPYFFTSLPPYSLLESRYNSLAIPASLWMARSTALRSHDNRRCLMAQHVATEQLTITDWVKALAAFPAREFTLQNVQDYVVHHAVLPDTLDKYCYFSKGSYTRNLIFRNDLFECMTVCWDIGQPTPIPTHRRQTSWMPAPTRRPPVPNYPVPRPHP